MARHWKGAAAPLDLVGEIVPRIPGGYARFGGHRGLAVIDANPNHNPNHKPTNHQWRNS